MKANEIEKRNRHIIAAYKNGISMAEAGRKYGVSERTVRRVLKDPAQEKAKQKCLERSRRSRAVVESIESGLSVKQVAKKCSLSESTVYRIGMQCGVCGKGKGHARKHEQCKNRNIEILREYEAGASVKALSEQYGISIGGLYRIIRNTKEL